MPLHNPSFVAEIDLGSSLFVKHSGTGKNNQVTLAVDGDAPIIGVTHEGSREAPIPGVTPLVAKAGEAVRVYGPGETCEVIAGAAVAAGKHVMADSAGKAIEATAGKYYGGRALTGAATSEKLQIQVEPGQLNA